MTPQTQSSPRKRAHRRPDVPAAGQRDADPQTPATTPAPLTPTQARYLRSLCHHLKPSVRLGNKGVTAALLRELALTLDHHELVKVKLSGSDRAQRQAQIAELLDATGSELVQQVGHVASLFRRNPDAPKLALPA